MPRRLHERGRTNRLNAIKNTYAGMSSPAECPVTPSAGERKYLSFESRRGMVPPTADKEDQRGQELHTQGGF